jgi:transposase
MPGTGRAYSQDLRDRVLSALDRGMKAREIVSMFQVSLAYIYKANIRRRDTGETCARPQRGHVALKLSGHEEALRAKVADQPDVRISDLRAWAQAELGISISHASMWKMLDRLGLTYKKRPSMPASKSARTSPRPGAAGRTSRSG